MGRPSNTETRKKQIVLGLMKAMARHGYSGASIQLIAKEARMTSGIVHYHFKSKQDVLVALIEHLMELADKRLAPPIASTSALDRLNNSIDAFLLKGKGESAPAVAAWVCVATEAIQHKDVCTAYSVAIKKRLGLLTALVSAALRENNQHDEEASAIAAGVLSLAEGAFQLSCSAPGVLPVGYAAKMAKQMIAASITD